LEKTIPETTPRRKNFKEGVSRGSATIPTQRKHRGEREAGGCEKVSSSKERQLNESEGTREGREIKNFILIASLNT
jgi:hypothetical protein